MSAFLLSIVGEDHAGRSAIHILKVEWKRDHLITTGGNAAQVETLNNDDVLCKKHKVRRVFFGLEPINGQVINADQPNAAFDEQFRSLRFQVNEVLVEAVIVPVF